MRNQNRIIASFLAAVTLCGCLSSFNWEIESTDALVTQHNPLTQQNPQARVCLYQPFVASTDNAVFVTRHNGQLTGALARRGGYCYRVEPGLHLIEVDAHLSNRTPRPSSALVFEAKPNQEYVFQVYTGGLGAGSPTESIERTIAWLPAEKRARTLEGIQVQELRKSPMKEKPSTLARPFPTATALPTSCPGERPSTSLLSTKAQRQWKRVEFEADAFAFGYKCDIAGVVFLGMDPREYEAK